MTSETLKKAIAIQEEMNKIEHALNTMEIGVDEGGKVFVGIKDNCGDIHEILKMESTDEHELVVEITKDMLTRKLKKLHKELESL